MPRQKHKVMIMDGLIMPTKIRKRGCSSSSSSSSRIRNHRLNKRAGNTRAEHLIGLAGSRSTTPVPMWKTTPLRSVVDSPKSGRSTQQQQPVSARRLAATLWGMNEMPSPRMSESNLEVMSLREKKSAGKVVYKREKMQSGWRSQPGLGSLPPHLSDPSHSPTASERTEQSRTVSRQRTPSISQRLKSAEQNTAAFDSISNASFMEVETRSRAPTTSGSVSGGKNHLKDASNALTTAKELLKIINRIWARADQPSSSMSVISALHTELERARLQVNQHMKEQQSGRNDIDYLIKCFAEERASWKLKEQRTVEEAIESIANELEVERKLRRRVESLNKKLGKELVEVKSSFIKAVKDLESEKRAREITEQVYDELARNIDEDQVRVEKSVEVCDEAEKGRETPELAEKLHEERTRMKLLDAKHQFEDRSSTMGKLRKQLEVLLGTKRDKGEKRATHSSKSNIITQQNDPKDIDADPEDTLDSQGGLTESDLQSTELLTEHSINKRAYTYTSGGGHDIKTRNSIAEHVSRRSTSVLDRLKWSAEGSTAQLSSGDWLDRGRLHELEPQRRSYMGEAQGQKPVKGVKNHVPSSRLQMVHDCRSPSRLWDQPRPSRESPGALQEEQGAIQAACSKSRLGGEGQTPRRLKW